MPNNIIGSKTPETQHREEIENSPQDYYFHVYFMTNNQDEDGNKESSLDDDNGQNNEPNADDKPFVGTEDIISTIYEQKSAKREGSREKHFQVEIDCSDVNTSNQDLAAEYIENKVRKAEDHIKKELRHISNEEDVNVHLIIYGNNTVEDVARTFATGVVPNESYRPLHEHGSSSSSDLLTDCKASHPTTVDYVGNINTGIILNVNGKEVGDEIQISDEYVVDKPEAINSLTTIEGNQENINAESVFNVEVSEAVDNTIEGDEYVIDNSEVINPQATTEGNQANQDVDNPNHNETDIPTLNTTVINPAQSKEQKTQKSIEKIVTKESKQDEKQNNLKYLTTILKEHRIELISKTTLFRSEAAVYQLLQTAKKIISSSQKNNLLVFFQQLGKGNKPEQDALRTTKKTTNHSKSLPLTSIINKSENVTTSVEQNNKKQTVTDKKLSYDRVARFVSNAMIFYKCKYHSPGMGRDNGLIKNMVFDCSGLISRAMGLKLSDGQWHTGILLTDYKRFDNLGIINTYQKGDVLVWDPRYGHNTGHAVIFLGCDQIFAAHGNNDSGIVGPTTDLKTYWIHTYKKPNVFRLKTYAEIPLLDNVNGYLKYIENV